MALLGLWGAQIPQSRLQHWASCPDAHLNRAVQTTEHFRDRWAPARALCPTSACSWQTAWQRQSSCIRAAPAIVVEDVSAGDVTQVLEVLLAGQDLSEGVAASTLQALVQSGDAAQISAFLVLLRAKGETAEEVAGLAKAMLEEGLKVNAPGHLLDIVGTGGDGIGSVNISTGSAVLAAAAGAKVAKHGNRSVSSKCGSADVLEALGLPLDLAPEAVEQCIEQAGLGFMFAPRYHPAMKTVAPVRKALKLRTAFNLLGPLLNPARAQYALVGVYSPAIAPLMAAALLRMDVKKALVVHSLGLDELTPMGPAEIVEVTSEGALSYTLDPKRLGIPRCDVDDLKGGDAPTNAAILKDVFGGQQGPVADALCLNAGVALAACNVAGSPADGVKLAQEVQRSGKAADKLQEWISVAQQASRSL